MSTTLKRAFSDSSYTQASTSLTILRKLSLRSFTQDCIAFVKFNVLCKLIFMINNNFAASLSVQYALYVPYILLHNTEVNKRCVKYMWCQMVTPNYNLSPCIWLLSCYFKRDRRDHEASKRWLSNNCTLNPVYNSSYIFPTASPIILCFHLWWNFMQQYSNCIFHKPRKRLQISF